MNKSRQQENHRLPERIQRTYSINGAWYFELRGGGQKGPYESEHEMQAALQEFIQLHHELTHRT
jgi:hypothetical protein